MKQKTFCRLLIAVTALGAALTAAHLCYIVEAYQHCSIIQFIAEEMW